MPSRFGFDYPNPRPWIPTPEEKQKLHATDATSKWLCNLPQEILHQYAGRWIAAKDCRIIASGETMDVMLRELGDVDRETVIIDRIRHPGWTIYG